MGQSASQFEFNPYLAPETAGIAERGKSQGTVSPLSAAMIVWGSTGIAGAVFGFGLAGVIGAVFGLFIAGAAAVPVAAVSFVILRIVCFSGVSKIITVVSSATSGGLTGIVSTQALFGNAGFPYAAVAGVVGAVVPAVGVGLMSFSGYSFKQPDVLPLAWDDLKAQMDNATSEVDGRKDQSPRLPKMKTVE